MPPIQNEARHEQHDRPMLINLSPTPALEESPSVREPAATGVAAKRVLDVAVSALACLLVFPAMLLISFLIKVTSPGPVFFRWRVIGKDGQPMVGYKFRTMIDGADRVRERLSEQNEMTGIFFKMRNDPRVTPVGRILRRFSLDELPQLWSVLKGDMSLVGPRPTQTFEYEQLNDWQKQRAKVKPGTVSLWIVAGKTTDFDEMIRLDLDYIKHWSIWLDLKILLRAVPYVLFGKNC